MEVEQKPVSGSQIRFGSFEMDLQTGELRRAGIRVRLQAQPFRMLSVLVEHAGQVVSRDELQQRLWGSATTVDFDHGLNIAVNKIREVLEDSADAPRFVETLSKRGYRFVAPVTVVTPQRTERVEVAGLSAPVEELQAPVKSAHWPKSRWVVLAAGAVLLLLVAGLLWTMNWGPRPLRIREITYSGRVYPGLPLQESLGQTATDGTRIYFPQIQNGRAILSQASIGDGESSLLPISSAIPSPMLQDISPDGSKLLVRNQLARETEGPLWIMPTIGGNAQQFSDIQAHDGTWMPDGRRILYATGTDLMVANEDGTERKKVTSLPGRAFWLRWSPDGSVLRFTLLNVLDHIATLWEMSADGKAHPLLGPADSTRSECCGSWTADGKNYVFQSSRDGLKNIWAMREGGLLPRKPFQVTNGPLSYQSPITARSGNRIFFLGLNARSELLQYDSASKLFLPKNNILNSAQFVRFSRDGQWVAWIGLRGSTLWRSRTDGTRRLQLTAAPMEVYMMQWSADGQRLAVMGREPGKLWRIYVVNVADGDMRPLLTEERNEADPDWSADGNEIVFGRTPDVMAERAQPKEIYILELKTGQFAPLPGSQGLFSPRWSPDGRYITAMPLGQKALMLFDRTTGVWKTLASRPAADPVWSQDGKWVYFHDFVEESQGIYRVSVPDGRVEQITELGNLQSIDIADFRFVGLAPGEVPLIRARMSTANIYSADLDEVER